MDWPLPLWNDIDEDDSAASTFGSVMEPSVSVGKFTVVDGLSPFVSVSGVGQFVVGGLKEEGCKFGP